MRQFNKYRGSKGFVVAAERGIRFRYMIQKNAEKRALILTFWHRYGLAATHEAFQVSRPTLFRWQAKLKETKGKLEGLNKSPLARRCLDMKIYRRERERSISVRYCFRRRTLLGVISRYSSSAIVSSPRSILN